MMRDGRCLRSFAKYASLNVLGMLGLSCYILADTFFISQGMGAAGLAALNLAIPIYSLIHGSGLMAGIGGSIRFALAPDRAEKDRAFTCAALAAGLLAAAFFTLGLTAAAPLAKLVGADEAVFAMTETYLRVILLFAPLFLLNNLLLAFVRNDGAPQRAMAAMLGGSFANILLDWLFIFPMGMGIFGAVLATGFAPAVSMAILAPFFIRRQNHFTFCRCKLSGKLLGQVLAAGLPSLIAELSSGIVMAVFNSVILGIAGNLGVASYGIAANIALVTVSLYGGIAQGAQPLLSRFCGEGDKGAARAILHGSLLTALLLAAALYAGIFFLAEPLAAVFNSGKDPALQQLAVRGLKLYFLSSCFAAFNINAAAGLAAAGKTFPAHLISLLRGFVLILPAAAILPLFWGMDGVWLALPAAEGLSFLVSLWSTKKYDAF